MADDYDSDDDNDDESVVPDLVAVHDPAQPQPPPLPPPCPVTILSGFLGSGKTTLINYILKSPNHGKRIAVIENEFGDGLQVERMIAREGIDDNNSKNESSPSLLEFIELPNGCICCQVKDSLVLTLEALIARRSDLDYILIECSGMANPGPIASLFWLDEGLSRLRLDGIVVLVDSYHIERQLAETIEASQQIGFADRILLNKIDLIDQEEQQRLQTILQSIQPTAPIRPTTFAAVPDLDWILDSQCFDAERAQQELERYEDTAHTMEKDTINYQPGEDPHCTLCDEAGGSCHHHVHHSHTKHVSTTCLKLYEPVDMEKIHHWLASILWPNQDEKDHVLRARIENDEQSTHEIERTATENVSPNDLSHPDSTTQAIFRIKGILDVRHLARDYSGEHKANDDGVTVAFVDEDGRDRRKYIVQAVHDLWDVFPSSSEWENEEERCSKLIVIGRHLNFEELQRGFDSCVAIDKLVNCL